MPSGTTAGRNSIKDWTFQFRFMQEGKAAFWTEPMNLVCVNQFLQYELPPEKIETWPYSRTPGG